MKRPSDPEEAPAAKKHAPTCDTFAMVQSAPITPLVDIPGMESVQCQGEVVLKFLVHPKAVSALIGKSGTTAAAIRSRTALTKLQLHEKTTPGFPSYLGEKIAELRGSLAACLAGLQVIAFTLRQTEMARRGETVDSGDYTVRMLTPEICTGYLIGRSGTTFKALQATTGAKLYLQNDTEVLPGQPDRVLTISGTMMQVLHTAGIVLNRVSSTGVTSSTVQPSVTACAAAASVLTLPPFLDVVTGTISDAVLHLRPRPAGAQLPGSVSVGGGYALDTAGFGGFLDEPGVTVEGAVPVHGGVIRAADVMAYCSGALPDGRVMVPMAYAPQPAQYHANAAIEPSMARRHGGMTAMGQHTDALPAVGVAAMGGGDAGSRGADGGVGSAGGRDGGAGVARGAGGGAGGGYVASVGRGDVGGVVLSAAGSDRAMAARWAASAYGGVPMAMMEQLAAAFPARSVATGETAFPISLVPGSRRAPLQLPSLAPLSAQGGLGVEPTDVVRFTIPQAMAGLIIGKNGSSILKLKQLTGAVVQLAPQQPDSTDRTVVVTGTAAACSSVREMILRRIAAATRNTDAAASGVNEV